MAAINKLTDTQIRNYKKAGRLNDGQGLYLHVSKGITKSWVFAWKGAQWVTPTNKSGRREMGLGGYPAISISHARALTAKYRSMVKEGKNPKEVIEAEKAKKERGNEIPETFGGIAAEYLELKQSGFRNPKHVKQWHKSVVDPTGYSAAITSKLITEITQDDVLSVFNPLWADRPETARRVLGRISSVLTYALAKKYRDGSNPADWSIIKHVVAALSEDKKEKQHFAALDYIELPSFFENVQTWDAMAARALTFTILTACRTSEALQAVWSEFDLDAATWSLPKERTKTHKPHVVPLPEYLVVMLTELHTTRINQYVFAGHKEGQPLSNMAMLMLLRRRKVDHITPHGFRSTFRNWVYDRTDFSDKIAEQALGHSNPNKVEAAYLRSDAFLKRQQLMRMWCDYCTGKQSADVLQFNAGASNG